MATVLDYLNAPEFTDDRMSEVINIPAYETGRPAQLGIFSDVAIPTTYVSIGITNDEITIIPARERGGEHNVNMRNQRQKTMITIPHFPLDDAITPSDIQNIMSWGEQNAFPMLGDVVNQKMATIRAKHDATWNHLDWGALNGMVIDAEGKLLVNLWDQFGITQTSVNFALDTAGTNIAAKNREVTGAIRRALRGSASRGAVGFAGPEFYDKYVGHANVLESLKAYPGATPNPAREDIAEQFRFAGITWERIDEEFQHRLDNGTFEALPAVADDEAIIIPMGTSYFKRFVAPPDTIQDANRVPSLGDKVFVSTDDLPHGKGKEVHTESNVLPICTMPEVIIKATVGA